MTWQETEPLGFVSVNGVNSLQAAQVLTSSHLVVSTALALRGGGACAV